MPHNAYFTHQIYNINKYKQIIFVSKKVGKFVKMPTFLKYYFIQGVSEMFKCV